jgi:hypothetical protein
MHWISMISPLVMAPLKSPFFNVFTLVSLSIFGTFARMDLHRPVLKF